MYELHFNNIVLRSESLQALHEKINVLSCSWELYEIKQSGMNRAYRNQKKCMVTINDAKKIRGAFDRGLTVCELVRRFSTTRRIVDRILKETA